MADVYMNHAAVEQAINDMVVATQNMSNALDNLVSGLTPMASSFTGEAARSWAEFQLVANTADQSMQNLFGKGANTLGQMQHITKDGDRRGAQYFYG